MKMTMKTTTMTTPAHPAPNRRHRVFRAFLFCLAIAGALAVSSTARADRGDLEVTFQPQLMRLTSKTMGPLTHPDGDGGAIAPTLRAAYAVTPFLDVFAGYRFLQPFDTSRPEDAGEQPFRVKMHAALVGARAHMPIVGDWLSLYGLVELEAGYLDVTADVGGTTGSQGAWSGGVTPEVGLDARWQAFETVALIFRVGVGYALRLDHDLDAIAFESEASSAQPLDLGAANLSGWTAGITFGARF
ncbi:MAG: hypothetical protein ACI9MR_001817 [Myxococcota bacterium]|jgi:hypothetical protein